jgi:hypothetical protein
MKPGSAIINTASVNSDMPNPILLVYATTKGAIQNFTGGLAQLLAEKEIRANAVAPGPIGTLLIPSTMPEDAAKNFGMQVPMKRAGQPAELETAYVMLAGLHLGYHSCGDRWHLSSAIRHRNSIALSRIAYSGHPYRDLHGLASNSEPRGWGCAPRGDDRWRIQLTKRSGPARTSFGSKRENLTVERTSFGVRRKGNYWRCRIFERLPTSHRLFCPVRQRDLGTTGATSSGAGSLGGRLDKSWTLATRRRKGARAWPFFVSETYPGTTRCPRKTIWKAHRIRVANTADRRASPNRCRDRQRRSRMRTSQRSVDRSVKLPVVPALCAMLPMRQQERSRRDGVLLSCTSRYRYWSGIQFNSNRLGLP